MAAPVPGLELGFLRQNGLGCLVVDISEPELRKAPDGYATLVGDVSSGDCFGPTAAQVGRFAGVGFDVERCVAYFGEDSHAPGPVLGAINRAWIRLMMRRPNYHLTTYATSVLRAR